jgi:hypothetical protein
LRVLALTVIISLITPAVLDAQSIPAGKMIQVKLQHSITTKTAVVGDVVIARVNESLKDGGDVVIPAGSVLHGRIDFVQRKSVSLDGSMRLLFSRFELPDGRSIATLASASFHEERPSGKRQRVVAIAGLAGVGALIGGKTKRVAGGLGGAIVGLVLTENRSRYGRDLTLRSGKTLQLRLSDDLVAPSVGAGFMPARRPKVVP